MTAVEGGDFEEGVRRINRILVVRGQVVPVTATPLTLHARCRDGSVVDGQSLIMTTSDIEQVWIPGGHRRCGAHRPGPRQPVHEPVAEPAVAGHP